MTNEELLTHLLELMAQSITERAILHNQIHYNGPDNTESLVYIQGEINAYTNLIKKICNV